MELVERAQEGDRHAFARLVEKHMKAVYAAARSFVGNHADADDLAQETFMRAYRSLPRFRGDSAFGTWLTSIAVNLCTNRIKRSRAVGSLPQTAEGELRTDGEWSDPVEAAARAEPERRLEHCLQALPPKLRAAMHLVVERDMSHKEAAEVLDCAPGTVSWRVFEARKILRARLKPFLQESGGK